MSNPVISTGGSGLPSRTIFYGSEKAGKTSTFAYASNPIFAMAKGETGLLSLLDGGIIPPTPHFDEVLNWDGMRACVKWLTEAEHTYRSFVVDTANQTQELLFEHITRAKYGNDREKFNAYGKGVADHACPEWRRFLESLDKLRSIRKMAIIFLAHARVKQINNPEGDNYSEWQVDMDDKVYGLAAKWADIIMFVKPDIVAIKERGETKAKAQSAGTRTMHTVGSASWKAGNRYNLPPEIPMGKSPQQAWDNFYNALRKARQLGVQLQMATAEVPVVDPSEIIESTDNKAEADGVAVSA